MNTFGIGNKENMLTRGGAGFGSIQTTQKAQQENAEAKKAEEKKASREDDTVSISDEAKLIIGSQLNKFGTNGNLVDAASASGFVKQVRKAQDEIDEKNATKNEEAEADAKNEGDLVIDSSATGKAGSAEGVDSQEKMKQDLKKQIKEKQAEIQALASDKSEEGEMKVQMLEVELMALQNTLTQMEASEEK